MPLDLTRYRDRLEAMTAEALDEQYRHGAGLKPTLELTRIYERYADLTTLEQAQELTTEEAPVELRRFAAEAYMGDAVKTLTDQIGNLEAALTVPFGEEHVPYLAVRPRLINEPDAAHRSELWRARVAVTDRELNPVLIEIAERERDHVRELGAETTLALFEGFQYDPMALWHDTDAFLAETDDLYAREIDRALRQRVGISLDQAGPTRTWPGCGAHRSSTACSRGSAQYRRCARRCAPWE